MCLNLLGRGRVRQLGTFGVTSVAGLGADSLRPLSPWTALLHYGALDERGTVTIRLTYDHRVMDGTPPARTLALMEAALRGELLAELRLLQPAVAA